MSKKKKGPKKMKSENPILPVTQTAKIKKPIHFKKPGNPIDIRS